MMDKIKIKPKTIEDFKDWAKRHGMPILCDDKKLAEALKKVSDRNNVIAENKRAKGIQLSKEVKVKS